MDNARKANRSPRLEAWGDVSELTRMGMTNPGNDAKLGSVMSNGQ